jgi:peptidoglycan/LPS O-acetylase OafA/YrhL
VTRIRGWLLVLCVLLLVWQPFSLALTTAGTLDELSLRGSGLAVILVARLLAAGLGIAAGLSLFQRKPGAVSIAKASLVFSAAVDVLVYATPYSPNNRPPGDALVILVVSLIYYAIWLGYLARSKRVRSTFQP